MQNPEVEMVQPKEQIPGEPVVNNIRITTQEYFRQRYLKSAVLTVIVTLALVLLIGRNITVNGAMLNFYALFWSGFPFIAFAVIGPFSFFYSLAAKEIKSRFIKQFAEANGYEYYDSMPETVCQAGFGSIGHSRQVTNYCNGLYKNHHVALFIYHFVTGSGKSAVAHEYTVFKINFNELVPEVLLKFRDRRFLENILFGESYGNKVAVPVPQEFAKTFELWAKSGFEVEALQIFDPAFMANLLDKWSNVSIELKDNDAYIFIKKFINSKDDLLNVYHLAQDMISVIEPRLSRMKNSVIALKNR